MTDPHDPLLLYSTFQEAVREWMKENHFRFVVPSIECWPEGVDSREEARDHYSEEAATEIIENWERIYNEEVSEE